MAADPTAAIERMLAERANRPFGDTDRVSGLTLQSVSQASQEAATNLLVKAVRALNAGDGERARRFVDRAVALPFDRHEEMQPVAGAASMMLFNGIVDALELCDEDDDAWLTAAIAVLGTSDDEGRGAVRAVLDVVGREYEVSAAELRLLRRAIADVPPQAELRDRRLGAEDLAVAVLSTLTASRAYGAELDRAWGTGPT